MQRMEDQSQHDKSKKNVASYATDFYKKYSDIIDQIINEGFVVRGHASGKSGSGMNQQTKDDLRKLRDLVRERNGSIQLTDEEEEEWGSISEKKEKLPPVNEGSHWQMDQDYCQARMRAKYAKEDGTGNPRDVFLTYINAIWAKKGYPESWKQSWVEKYDKNPY